MKTIHLAFPIAVICSLFGGSFALAAGFDFTRPEDCQGWQATHHVSGVRPLAEGLEITINGDDPYITGPARDFTVGQLLWMTIKLRSDQEGMAQVFYFDRAPSEERSVRFPVRAGEWEEVRMPMPALGSRYHLRFDPPGTAGRVVLAKLVFEDRVSLTEPSWSGFHARPEEDWLSVRAGETELLHGRGFSEFAVRAGDRLMASGMPGGKIGYVSGGRQRWLDLTNAITEVRAEGAELVCKATVRDGDGAAWTLTHRFAPMEKEGGIRVTVSVSVDRTREVAFVPMLVLFPGSGTFGRAKTQGLFPGLEYLDGDEPSSSEADIVGPGSKRQVPDTLKVTIPLMAIAAGDRYVALAWRPEPHIAPLFDSPDRVFNSGGNVMGLLYPGSTGNDRPEGNLLPHGPVSLTGGATVSAECHILTGRGSNCVAAVKQYVRMNGLPPVPSLRLDLQEYVRLAAAGWLESEVRETDKFRHAWPGDFAPQPAADAAWMMEWLAAITKDAKLAAELTNAAAGALRQVRPESYNGSGVSHVRYPVTSLLYGHVAENVAHAREAGSALLKRFEPDGSVLYRPGKTDYGRTHFARDANGLTAQSVAALLEHASISGDANLLKEGLRMLRAMDKFLGSAPRGAQTWECPLHTPDILASAYLVKAYVSGYELTGDRRLLESANYWAWTGVPFVYLVKPANRETGLYATIAVYGATSWVAPNWMGLPVQWCGLVYADALYQLNKHDGAGPWKQLADGIVISGIQQTFPIDSASRRGLLPDSYVLRAGVRQNPAINPGTVQAPAMHYFGRPIYEFASCRLSGLLVHAPGAIRDLKEDERTVRFRIEGVIKDDARVLVSRCKAMPVITVNGRNAEVEWLADAHAAVFRVGKDASVEITTR